MLLSHLVLSPLYRPGQGMSNNLKRHLSLFVDHQFGSLSVFFMGADQQKIHIRDDGKASFPAKQAIEPGTGIVDIVREKTDIFPIGKPVGEIDRTSGQHAQAFYLRQPVDTQFIEFICGS